MIYSTSLLCFFALLVRCENEESVGGSSSQMITAEGESLEEYVEECRKYQDKQCSELSNLCLDCQGYNEECNYGEWSNRTCRKKPDISCQGDHVVQKEARCVFCYQTESWEHTCSFNVIQPCTGQTKYYRSNCTVKPEVMCLGPRKFNMRLRCNVTRGHRWSTALILSITLGGFGADRFYLGHWQEGIGKLFSFGGLGVWTLVDVLLIAIRYLGPADGSLYV